MNLLTAAEMRAVDEATIAAGTPGEVLKFLPGISMDYSAGEARTISINGVPSANVPITSSTVGSGGAGWVVSESGVVSSGSRSGNSRDRSPSTTRSW